MFLLVMYQLAQLLITFCGIKPDFTLSSMVRDRDGHLKFLKKSKNQSNEYFNEQLTETFLAVLSASDKAEEQQKWLENTNELPKILR